MFSIGAFQESWKHDQISLITLPPKSNLALNPTFTIAPALAVLPFTNGLLERVIYTHSLYFLTSSMFLNPLSHKSCPRQFTESILIQVTKEFLIAHSSSIS